MDWKEKLALLGGSQPEEKKPETNAAPARRKRGGVVYSTDAGYDYQTDEVPEAETLPPDKQRLHIHMERAGRGGKTVTLVRGFVGAEAALAELSRRLKTRLGVGGTAKDGEIVVQGDHRNRLAAVLRDMGYKVS